MHIHNSIKQRILQSCPSRALTTTSSETFQKSIQVSLLGAHTPLGKYTSFLLKQNPMLSVLNVQGNQTLEAAAFELNHIDTKCKVQYFEGDINAGKSIRSADIVVMLGVERLKDDTSLADRVMAEGRRVHELAIQCTIHAPRSIVLVCVKPVSVFTPLVASVFKETNWYSPARIIGSAATAQTKANTLLGRYQDLDPSICQVPIIGGPDQELAVPLFSRAKPVELTDMSANSLMAKFRGIREDEFPKKMSKENLVDDCPLCEAFSLNHMITTMAMGICGDKHAYYNAFVRSNFIGTCKHIVSTLQFSRGGVVHNCGVPQLTQLELKMFERATLQIKDREQMAKDFVEYLVKGSSELPPFKIKDMEKKKKLQQNIVRC